MFRKRKKVKKLKREFVDFQASLTATSKKKKKFVRSNETNGAQTNSRRIVNEFVSFDLSLIKSYFWASRSTVDKECCCFDELSRAASTGKRSAAEKSRFDSGRPWRNNRIPCNNEEVSVRFVGRNFARSTELEKDKTDRSAFDVANSSTTPSRDSNHENENCRTNSSVVDRSSSPKPTESNRNDLFRIYSFESMSSPNSFPLCALSLLSSFLLARRRRFDSKFDEKADSKFLNCFPDRCSELGLADNRKALFGFSCRDERWRTSMELFRADKFQDQENFQWRRDHRIV